MGIWLLMAMTVYGLYVACETIAARLLPLGSGAAAVPQQLAVVTQNQEDGIEGFVRSLLGLLHRSHRPVPSLLIVDLASTDETPLILERMARHESLQVMTAPAGALDSWLMPGAIATVVDLREGADIPARLRVLCNIFQ